VKLWTSAAATQPANLTKCTRTKALPAKIDLTIAPSQGKLTIPVRSPAGISPEVGKAHALRTRRTILASSSTLAAIIAVLLPPSLCAAELPVSILPIQPTSTSGVNFTVQDWGAVTSAQLMHLSSSSAESQGQYFNVDLDTGSFTRDKVNRFQFDLYIQKNSDSGAEQYHVYEDPVGVFTDYVSSITINYKSSGIVDSATLTGIPLHAQFEGPSFSSTGSASPFPVELGSTSSINLPLVSNLPNLQVAVSEASVSSANCKQCWLGTLSATYPSTVQPKGSAPISLTVQPNTLHALFSSAFVVNPHQPHDTLAVYITSTPDQGGLPSSQEIDVPVRFTPSFLYLASAVILGSLIGFGIRRLIPASDPKTDDSGTAPAEGRLPRWARDLLLSVATAVLVELFGLVLFNNTNTSVVVFGFSLDPTQVVPALLVAILVAGGPPVASKISEAIKL
jgi:hypothetical protein